MSQVKMIVVDDNVGALDVVENYAQKVPWVTLSARFTSPVEALNFLRQNEVDIVLVDVQMDEISGLEFITIAKSQDKGKKVPVFIIISSYEKYAINGYELDIADYLLKPFRFDRFLLAIEKGRTRSARPSSVPDENVIFIRNGAKNVKVNVDKVKYIRSFNHIVKLYLAEETPLLLNQTIQNIINLLEPYNFIQIHKQFVVNTKYVREVSSTSLVIDTNELPVGRKYRKQVLETILS